MFSNNNKTENCISFNPSWKQHSVTKESCSQTIETEKSFQETQNPERNAVEVQTELFPLDLKAANEVNVFNLLAFLQRTSPLICAQLERNLNSKAFDGYELIGDSESKETELLREFEHRPWSEKFLGSDIAWNSTGSVLALGFGTLIHDSWCDHDSGCALWNTGRIYKNGEPPQSTAETDCCVTALAFHPQLPAILALGKFSGVITLFDMFTDEDATLISTEEIVDGHKDAITGLHWEDKLTLVSCSLDGKILVWKLTENMNSLKIINGFLIQSQHLPQRQQVTKGKNAEVGVTCFTFNSEDPSLFIAGTEGGALFQCSLNSQAKTNETLRNGIDLKSPIGMKFSLHNGYIEDVHFSPNTRNIFLSCSSDGQLNIYTLLQINPVLTLRAGSSFKSARWSPVCPMLLAAVTAKGQLSFYDLTSSRSNPAEIYETKSQVSNISFNPKDFRVLATASINGKAQVWQLNNLYHSARKNELQKLVALGSLQSN